jgi:hypothetical protein
LSGVLFSRPIGAHGGGKSHRIEQLGDNAGRAEREKAFNLAVLYTPS